MKTILALVVAVFAFGNQAFAQFPDFVGQLDTYQAGKRSNVINQMADVDALITTLSATLTPNFSNDVVIYINNNVMNMESLYVAGMYNYAMEMKNNAVKRRAVVQTRFDQGDTAGSNGRVLRLLSLDAQAVNLFYQAIAHFSFCESELMQIYMDCVFADGILQFVSTKVPRS